MTVYMSTVLVELQGGGRGAPDPLQANTWTSGASLLAAALSELRQLGDSEEGDQGQCVARLLHLLLPTVCCGVLCVRQPRFYTVRALPTGVWAHAGCRPACAVEPLPGGGTGCSGCSVRCVALTQGCTWSPSSTFDTGQVSFQLARVTFDGGVHVPLPVTTVVHAGQGGERVAVFANGPSCYVHPADGGPLELVSTVMGRDDMLRLAGWQVVGVDWHEWPAGRDEQHAFVQRLLDAVELRSQKA